MGRWEELKKTLGDSFVKALDNEVRPGDETQPANNLRNLVIDKLGLPQEWTQTVAEEKQHIKDLPMNMGMSGGTIGKSSAAAKATLNTEHITPEIVRVAKKAKEIGVDNLDEASQKLLQDAYNKMNGIFDNTYVQATRQEAAAAKDMANINVRPKVIDTQVRPVRFEKLIK